MSKGGNYDVLVTSRLTSHSLKVFNVDLEHILYTGSSLRAAKARYLSKLEIKTLEQCAQCCSKCIQS